MQTHTIGQVMDGRYRVVGVNWDKVEDLRVQKNGRKHWTFKQENAAKLNALKMWAKKMRAAKMAKA